MHGHLTLQLRPILCCQLVETASFLCQGRHTIIKCCTYSLLLPWPVQLPERVTYPFRLGPFDDACTKPSKTVTQRSAMLKRSKHVENQKSA